MKKLFIFSVLTLSAFAIQAQVNFGVKAGANFTKFSGKDAGTNSMLVGFAGGGLVNYKLADAVSLQGEVLYSIEGAKSKEGDIDAKLKTGFINVPILAQYNHSSGLYLETGPQIGFLLSAKASGTSEGVSASVDVKDGFKSTNFSWGFGAGYKLENGLGIGARYNLGLPSIVDEGTLKLGGFHVGLSYTFGGK